MKAQSDDDSRKPVDTLLLENLEKRITYDGDLRKTRIVRNAIFSSTLVEEVLTTTEKQIKKLRQSFPNDKDFIQAITLQYTGFLEERRNLDTLGWAIFGVAFGLSVGSMGIILTSEILGWVKIIGLLFSGFIYWYGHILLTHSRLTRRIQRVLAMAIEDTVGWFHLTTTEIANKPVRESIETYIRTFSAIYIAAIGLAILWIILEIIKGVP